MEDKMSTKQRYGRIVYKALKALTREDVTAADGWASASAVGEVAEVSTMTARKHLCQMYDEGLIEKTTIGGVSGFRVVRMGGN